MAIRLEVEEYCQNCLEFSPDVQPSEKVYYPGGEVVVGDTIVRCEYRKRCANLVRYLEKQKGV